MGAVCPESGYSDRRDRDRGGFLSASLTIWFHAKKWFYNPFPNFWDAVKGCARAPFEFLESRINESEAELDVGRASF